MSFYDDASIVMIPSGYKAGKLYSAKPTDGAGDLTFTRTGSTATRVIESGLIEKCRTNLVLNSATLVTQNVTVVAAPYTLSIFGTGSVVLSGVAIATLTGTGAANRVSLTFTPTAGTLTLTVAGSVTSAQLETGDIATDYIPTTAAAVTVGPIANLPRLDYTGGGCPKLLMEPTRTNLVTFSEQFNNAAWVKNSSTVTANSATSPDGYINADNFIDTAVVDSHTVNASISIATSSIISISCYLKQNTSRYGGLRLFVPTNGVGVGRFSIVIDLQTGIITSTLTSGETILNLSYSVVYAGNGWYRAIISGTSPVGTAVLSPWIATNATPINGGFAFENYLGTGRSIYLYGAQLEAGSYATSYIPTWNASVTRNADISVKTGITSLIGQTEGTLFIDFNATQTASLNSEFSISDGTTGNAIRLRQNTSNFLQAVVSLSGTPVVSISTTSEITKGSRYKMAISYQLNNFAFYVNGSQIGLDALGGVPACSQIQNTSGAGSTSSDFNGALNQILLFKTRLLNADLATLTTL